MAQWLEIFPKTQLLESFTQSLEQSLDTKDAAFATIQFWVDGLVGGDTVTITIEEAIVNEDSQYNPSENQTILLDVANPIQQLEIAVPLRFLRLSFFLGALAGVANVRSEIYLHDM